MILTIHLNDIVKVNLTSRGKEILENHPQRVFYSPSKTGELQLPLWDFIRIFGRPAVDSILDGNPVIVKNTLVIGGGHYARKGAE
ncbi:hypothetical protein KKH23_04755 [Patescibacteria group bacterium]|nr:hypothetical protein [Patescibacteria group bacterium]